MPDNYHLEEIYQGGYSTLDPNTGFVGYRIPSQKIGLATDPRTANILAEVSTKLQTGAKEIEVSVIQPSVFESIPNQQLKEVQRLSKLTGIDISVHAPLIEPSGISQQGVYSDIARQEAERQMSSAVERSHQMSPNGNVPVTFHSSATWQGPEYKKTEEGSVKVRIPVINQETGQVASIAQEIKRMNLGMSEAELKAGGAIQTAEERIEVMNSLQWLEELNQLIAIKNRADRILQESAPMIYPVIQKAEKGEIDLKYLNPDQNEALSRYRNAGHEIHDIHRHLTNMFERAYKYGSGDERRKLAEISNNFKEEAEKLNPNNFVEQSRLMQGVMEQFRPFNPEVFKPIEDFAVGKTAETFGNVAFNSYKKFGSEAPIISIENPPIGSGLSRAEDMKKVVEEARKIFVNRATNEGINKNEAEKQADRLIGVTWDVGHINMMRKYGFTEEDVIKEAQKVGPLVKHVHLSDNFGFEHTELPMGMGNVPIKQIMEKLGQKGFEARKIIEAGNWWEHFKTSPFQQTLEAFGSPIYGIKMQPYWNQAVGVQGYFGGFGNMLPQINYETFGTGFSMLPAELGGQRQTGRSRMGGQPLE